MCSINSLAIKLGNSNCRLAYASLTEWGDLSVNCLNGADEQFATRTMFTIKSNRQYSESFEQCLAGSDESDPVNIIFDALNVHHFNSALYIDEEFGNIFAKKESKNGNYKLEFWEDCHRREWIVQFRDIEVIAGILSKLLNLVRQQLPNEDPIRQIVITIPSFAKYEYREKITKAAEIIGLASTDIQLMDQITAVAIAYRQKEGDEAQGHVLFFYMGAKSTEFAVFNFLDGQTPEIVFSNGFVDFGGENFTHSLVGNQMANLKKEEREKWRKMSTEEKRGVYRNVRKAMEKIKAQLGCKELATVKIDLGPTFRGRQFKIERKQFEEICKEECQKVEQFIGQAFNESKYLPIKRVVLAGNSSKLYLIKKFIAKYCPPELIMPMNALAPELAVIHGAAFKALAESFVSEGNAVPKCLSQAMIPSFAFYGIYGKKFSTEMPFYVLHSGEKMPTKQITTSFRHYDQTKWYEESISNCNEENDQRIMQFQFRLSAKFGVRINKNGLIEFRDENGKLMENKDLKMENAKKRFLKYQADVLRLKKEEEEWEENRKREMQKRLQKELTMEPVMKKRIKIEVENEKENGNVLGQNGQQLERKNSRRNKQQSKCRGFEEEEEEDESGPENRGDFANKNEDQKPLAIDEPTTSSATEKSGGKGKKSFMVDILFEFCHNKENGAVIRGSWDNWAAPIPMEYSQLTNSYITVVRIQPSDEYEFLFEIRNDALNHARIFYCSNDYESRKSQQFSENRLVNVINLNLVKNENNEKLVEYNKKKLKKVIAFDNAMLGMREKTKENAKYMAKYMEIRKALKLSVMNDENLGALEGEMDRTQIYMNINIHYLKWKGIEEQNSLLNNSKNAKAIRLEFKKHLDEFTASKEGIFSLYKNNFCEQLMAECLKIGLSQRSKEFRELIKMMDTKSVDNLSNK